MKAITPSAILSLAIREFLDELAELISEDILEENGKTPDELVTISQPDGW